jgi:hypothetical protein
MSPMELEHVFGLLDPSSIDMPKELSTKVALNGKMFDVVYRDSRSFYAEKVRPLLLLLFLPFLTNRFDF